MLEFKKDVVESMDQIEIGTVLEPLPLGCGKDQSRNYLTGYGVVIDIQEYDVPEDSVFHGDKKFVFLTDFGNVVNLIFSEVKAHYVIIGKETDIEGRISNQIENLQYRLGLLTGEVPSE